jgi:hypothetical protein
MLTKTLTRTLRASIFCGLIAVAIQPTTQAATPSLAGSWQITLTPVAPASTGAIPGLATFTSDGSTIETDASEVVPNPSAPNTYGTPGHGIWQPLPSGTGLYVQYISIVANSDGSLYAKNETTITVTLNSTSTSFSGSYTTDTVTATGTVTTVSGTISGTLIPHPKLP